VRSASRLERLAGRTFVTFSQIQNNSDNFLTLAPKNVGTNDADLKFNTSRSQSRSSLIGSLDVLCAGSKRSFSTKNNEATKSEQEYRICFLRHGQSTWNQKNIFIGWTDTPLTNYGVQEAQNAGQMLSKSGIKFDEVHTSLLRRSIRTANLALMELGQEYIPVHKHWRLNERSYGALVGQNKKEAVKRFGKDQVKIWRRSYDNPPPPMKDNHPYHPLRDPRYRLIADHIPKSESLKDTLGRSKVYWEDVLVPSLKKGKVLLVVGHENNLRSLIMNLEGISAEDIINLNLPRAIPLAYRLNTETLEPVGTYDAEATGVMLRGEWLCPNGSRGVKEILKNDNRLVYDTSSNINNENDLAKQKLEYPHDFLLNRMSMRAVG